MNPNATENLSIITLVSAPLAGALLGTMVPPDGEPFAWILALLGAGPLVVAAAVLWATANIVRAVTER